MTPILYAKTERFFTSNGLGRLADCRRCEVTEERNGEYICQFEYPIDGPLYDQIQEGGYIFTTHDESGKPQAFQIYHRSAPLEGFVTFYAWHISYQLNQIILKPFTAASCSAAMAAMPANSINYNPWTFWTNKAVAGTFRVNTPKSVRSALGGAAGSILDVYGKGDYEFDMFTVRLYTNRGADRGASIRYGKNLVSLDQQKDASNLYNAVIPYWTDNDGGSVVSLNYPIYANANQILDPLETHEYEIITTETLEAIMLRYPELFTIALDLSNKFEEAPTAEQLAAAAQDWINASDNYELKENLKVDFVALWQTEEYKQYAALQRVYLCDTVHIYYDKLGINATAKVIKTVYDSLNERYSSIELGTPKTTLGQQITDQISGEMAAEYPTRSQMQAAIDRQTALLTGNNGGVHVQIMNADGQPQEDLWMDTDDVNTAQNILRINRNGIGFSRTGINGPYFSAWTIDGSFNADFITTGTLNVDRIASNSVGVEKLAGQITGGLADSWEIDLTTGQLTIGNISAANITTGTLDAARIAAGSIAVSQLTDAAKAALMISSSSKAQYYLSTSASSATGGSWSDTVPTWSSGKYIWTRTATTKTFADNTTNTTYSTAVYDRALTTALSTASSAESAAGSAQTAADSANAREQIIYHSAASGTTSIAANTTWVTAIGNTQNAWTTRRPVYSSSYPVLFIATQRQTVAQQAAGTSCSCTTPVIDQTTTVIDGGHITTGTIDAGVVNVTNINASNITSGTMSANFIKAGTIADDLTTPKNYWNLSTGQFVTQQGTLGGFTIDSTGISAATTGAGGGSTNYTPQHIYFHGSTVLAPISPFTEIDVQGLKTGILDTDGRSMLTNSIIALTSTAYTHPTTGNPTTAITCLGDLTQTWGIYLTQGIDYTYNAINIATSNFTVNSHQVLEVH